MEMKLRLAAVLQVLEGHASVEAVAALHGVTAAEVEAWRALYLTGLRHGAAAQDPSPRARRLSRKAGLAVAGLAALIGGAAWAQLVTFTPDTPALASQVNANFNQLRVWLEQKVGPVGPAVRVASTEDVGVLGTAGAVVVGTATALNLGLDTDEIQARNANGTSPLTLQRRGGDLILGNSASSVSVPGNLTLGLRASAGVALSSAGPLPLVTTFTTEGGTVILFVSGSVFGASNTVIGFDVVVDGVTRRIIDSYVNEAGSHKALVTRQFPLSLSAGVHSLQLVTRSGTSSDFNDRFEVSFIELPL